MKYNGFALRLVVAVLGMVLHSAALKLSASPVILTNTLRVTATDVVGQELKFTAAFSSGFPITYQWQVLRNGTTNNLPGATSSTLVLSSLTTNDTGLYRLRATDAQGEAFSAARPLTVSGTPAPEGNFVTAVAAQTGPGNAGTNFSPTWTVTPGSLIAGQLPSAVGPGNFSQFGSGLVMVLTDNSPGHFNYLPNVGGSPAEVTCGTSGGTSVTYALPAAPNGYALTNVVIYGGWGDAGRDRFSLCFPRATAGLAGPSPYMPKTRRNPSTPPSHPGQPARFILAVRSSALVRAVFAISS
jgi:hypothetical protein